VIQQYCKQLRVPTMGAQFRPLAEAAINQQQSHLDFLEALLSAEIEEREHNLIQRRLKDARLPKTKTLDEFNFSSAPHIPAGKLNELAEGDYSARAEPVLFIGDTDGENALTHRAVCGRLPAEAARAVCQGHGTDQ
jgi:DNA replication protein DnaC